MANSVLLMSGAYASLLHFVSFLYYGTPLPHVAFQTASCLTTVWNHGTTSDVAKWSDRAMMAAAVLYHLRYDPAWFVVWTAVPAYFAAKATGDDRWHIAAHAAATWGNLNALAAVSTK